MTRDEMGGEKMYGSFPHARVCSTVEKVREQPRRSSPVDNRHQRCMPMQQARRRNDERGGVADDEKTGAIDLVDRIDPKGDPPAWQVCLHAVHLPAGVDNGDSDVRPARGDRPTGDGNVGRVDEL